MKKLNDNETALSSLTIEVTPDSLRNIALRLETTASSSALPGEAILYRANDRITLIYKPEISHARFLNAVDVIEHQV